ncbi:conserved hypothetical protein [Histoplasma capsulatum G186AR]|uniref:Tyrosine specific protein phosphatases domain-containing protein n=1 Tax=Ajellomyces capsulatus (strain G186AR / H82 / ATCC MYA-2454 / RMSCC 2432) TaxID=447093 RepID=C0P0N5_AJECG|nr:uncharacterized protein HCBG_08965 [Histoplasma capsulatum G186AR]EEH02855.1 conserved hypothetical protein [Histoplasma capsulatum G186AR]
MSNLPCSPFYNVDGIANLRDLGGYAISPATSVRRNYIFRSASLSHTTPKGANLLTGKLGIAMIYDFRSIPECERSPSFDIPGTTRLHVPIFKDQDASPEGLALRYKNYASSDGPRGFVRAYAEILRAWAAGGAFRAVFEHIRDRSEEPLLFHCSAGKDRTGVCAALILWIAGVQDDEVIGREYELTEAGLCELRQQSIDRVLALPAFDGSREGAERMVSAKAAAIMATMTWVDEKYGGAEGYLRNSMGFSDRDIAAIRKNLIIQERAIL